MENELPNHPLFQRLSVKIVPQCLNWEEVIHNRAFLGVLSDYERVNLPDVDGLYCISLSTSGIFTMDITTIQNALTHIHGVRLNVCWECIGVIHQ